MPGRVHNPLDELSSYLGTEEVRSLLGRASGIPPQRRSTRSAERTILIPMQRCMASGTKVRLWDASAPRELAGIRAQWAPYPRGLLIGSGGSAAV